MSRPTLDELRAKIEAAKPKPDGKEAVGCLDCGWTGRRVQNDGGMVATHGDYPFGYCGRCGNGDCLVDIETFRERSK